MNYQESKTKDYGVNNCEGCLEKQRVDRQFEEIERLRQKLNTNRCNKLQGVFGSSTPSSQAGFLSEKQAKQGGGQDQWHENTEIPAENNYAEREVRKTVTTRKYGQVFWQVEANPREKLLEGLNKYGSCKVVEKSSSVHI